MKCTNKFVIFGQFAITKLSILLKNYEQIVNFWFSSGFRHFFEHFPPFFWCFCMICLLFPCPIFILQDVAEHDCRHTMGGRGCGGRSIGGAAGGRLGGGRVGVGVGRELAPAVTLRKIQPCSGGRGNPPLQGRWGAWACSRRFLSV